MTKRIIALLLALILTVGLLPTVALAAEGDTGTTTPAETSALAPADGYYTFNGDKAANKDAADITLSKTAVDNGNGTYTVTLEATAKTKVQPKPTEVVFVLDASGSMAWCCEHREHKNEGGGYACSHIKENKDLKSRWDTAKSAIQTMVSKLSQKLGDSVTFKYVVFDSEAYVCNEKFQVWDEGIFGFGAGWVDVTAGGSTHLRDGVGMGIDQFSDNPDTVKALIIVADGDSDDGYPIQSANDFKKNGGTIYTVGFMFKNDKFDSLASDGCKFNANNTNELTTAMGTIEAKIIGMIDDPLGDKVDLVANSLKLVKDDASSTQPDPTTKDDGRTITWTDKSGMRHVKLTYTVKLKDGVTTTVRKNIVDLNGNATFNYSYKQGNTTVSKSLSFPKPQATVYVASLEVKYQLEDGTVINSLGTAKTTAVLPHTFTTDTIPKVNDSVTANGKTYYVKSVSVNKDKANTELPANAENAVEHTIIVTLTETAPTASVTIKKSFDGLPEKYQPTPTITVKKDGKTIKSEATKELKVDLEPGTYTVEETIDNVTGFELVSTTLNNSEDLSFAVAAGETKTLTLTNSYTVRTHSIKYTVTGDIPAGAPSAPEETSTAAYDSPQRRENPLTFDGYTFTGWTLKSPETLTIADDGTFTMPDSDVVFEGRWTANTGIAYKVEYYWQNINNNDFTLHETVDDTGTTGETVTATEKTYPGFTYDSTVKGTLTSGIIKADGSLVLKLYYTRNKHNITYTYTDTSTVPEGAPELTGYNETNVKYGTKKNVKSAPTAPAGWTFSGWTTTDTAVENNQFDMPDNDVTFTGKWTKNADAGYTIEYYLETLTEGTFEKDNNRTISDRTGTIGTAASVTEADKKPITGFTFDANNTNNKLEGEIVSGDLLTLKLYYKRNSYKVTYQYTGTVTPEDATKLPDEVTYKYGAEVIVAAAATSADYIFSGWSRTGKFNMPAEDVTITGSWMLKDPTAVNVDLNNHIYKTFTSDTADIPNDKLTFNVTVSGKSDNAVSMTRSGSVEFTKQDVQDGRTSKAFAFASDSLTFTAAGEYTFEVVEGTTPVINGLTYNVNNEAHLFTIVVDKKENANELYVKEVRVGTAEYTGNALTATLAYATITNNYIEPKKTFDLNNTIFKTFTPVAGGLPIPTGEGISYTFTAQMTELTKESGNTGRNYTLKATLTGEVTEANKVPFTVEGANEVSFAPGTYCFLVQEDATAAVTGTVNGTIHNDSQAYLLTLTVKEDLSFETEVKETAVAMSLEESTPGLGTITFNNTYEEKEPGKCTIDFSKFVQKELTATGTKTASDVDFTVDVKGKEQTMIITSAEGEEAISTYADEFDPKYSRTLTAHFDSITGGETKTAPFNGSTVEIDHAGQYYFVLTEEKGTRTGVTYDDSTYILSFIVNEGNGKLVVSSYSITKDGSPVSDTIITFHNTIDTGKDDYYPIIIPTIINKDTGMLNKTDHFAYVIGYPDGTVHPNGQITRAEVATIFFRLLRDEVRDGAFTTSNSYSDVAYGKWYNNPISTMSALGIITGYPDGTFKPNKPITRAEFAAIAARFDETQSGKSATFSDVIGHWAAKEIGIAYYNDWIKGYPDGTFKPDQNITRAEAMTLINRVLERKPESPADLLTNMNKWTDNLDTSKWYYLDVQEATNSHGYTRKTFNYELWRQMLPDPDWSRYER